MGKTRDLFKKIRDTKGTFHAKMGLIKDRNGMGLTSSRAEGLLFLHGLESNPAGTTQMDGVGREIGGFQDGGTHVHLSGELVISLVLSYCNKNLK